MLSREQGSQVTPRVKGRARTGPSDLTPRSVLTTWAHIPVSCPHSSLSRARPESQSAELMASGPSTPTLPSPQCPACSTPCRAGGRRAKSSSGEFGAFPGPWMKSDSTIITRESHTPATPQVSAEAPLLAPHSCLAGGRDHAPEGLLHRRPRDAVRVTDRRSPRPEATSSPSPSSLLCPPSF